MMLKMRKLNVIHIFYNCRQCICLILLLSVCHNEITNNEKNEPTFFFGVLKNESKYRRRDRV